MACAAAASQAHNHNSAATMIRIKFPCYARRFGGWLYSVARILLPRREFLIGECRCVGHLDDNEGVIGRGMAGITSRCQTWIGFVELAPIAQLDCKSEERERLRYGGVDQIRHRQAFPARDRLRDDGKTLPELLEHVGRKWPVLRVSRQPQLGMTRLDQHAHER